MAKSALAKRSTTPVRRSGPSPKLVKLQTQMKALRTRTANTANEHSDVLIGTGAVVAFASYEKKHAEKDKQGNPGKALPTIMDLDPALVYGAALYLLGRKAAAGKSGRMLESAGKGLVTYAAGRSVYRGSVKVVDKNGNPIVAGGENDAEVSGLDDSDM